MYNNKSTGERVEMCWIQKDALFSVDQSSCDSGEELFILDGSLIVGDDEEYKEWGWLRFPPSRDLVNDKRKGLKAGSGGAQVYRKTGYLSEKALSMEKIQIQEEEDVPKS